MADLPANPFAIGLSPLGDRSWLIAGDGLPAYLAEKAVLRAKHGARVLAAEPETASAQNEVLKRVAGWQLTHYPEQFSKLRDIITINGVPDPVRLDLNDELLDTAGRLCAEDLVLMRKGETGWRLAAASLSFPSSWSLAEKFTRPMDEVHKPVPGFSIGTRNATLINRIFDNLAPDETVLRGNWSIYDDDELFHPNSHRTEDSKPDAEINTATKFLREERQTLTRLPTSGDILFTILVTTSPLTELSKSPSGRTKAANLLSQLEAMTPDQLAYKALTWQKNGLVAHLRQIVGGLV